MLNLKNFKLIFFHYYLMKLL